MNRTVLIIISIGVAAAFGILVFGGPKGSSVPEGSNVEVRDGVQYITVSAKGGYSPSITRARAGLPTKLIVETNGTYDCSAALVVREAGFQEILPQTGKTEIDLGTKQTGEKVEGVCGMGMYNFTINFESDTDV